MGKQDTEGISRADKENTDGTLVVLQPLKKAGHIQSQRSAIAQNIPYLLKTIKLSTNVYWWKSGSRTGHWLAGGDETENEPLLSEGLSRNEDVADTLLEGDLERG